MNRFSFSSCLAWRQWLVPGGMVVLVLIGFWLRGHAGGWGLPFRLHPDEMKYVGAGAQVHLGEWNPRYFRNPPGFSYMNAAWFPFWLQIQTPVYVPEWLGIDPLRLRPSTRVKATFLYRPFDLVAGARMLAALLGACTILWVFLLAREFVGKHLALGASALYTVSFLSVRDSHFATNDMAMAFWVTLAGWLMVKAYRGDRTRDWILASALGGIAVAMKYNAFPLLLALGVLRFLSLKKGEAPFPG